MDTAEQRIQSSIDFLTKLHALFSEYDTHLSPEMSNGYQQYVIGMDFDFYAHGINIPSDYIDADNILKEAVRLTTVKEQEYG